MGLDLQKVFAVFVLLVFAGVIWWQGELETTTEGGLPKIVDGDSLEFPNERVRLKGIDAPEGRQSCERDGKEWRCGRASTQALRVMVGRRSVRCEGDRYDRHNRLLAICWVGDVELNRAMVRDGWAVSYGGAFLREERAAKAEKKGIWSSKFERPVDWRRAHQR